MLCQNCRVRSFSEFFKFVIAAALAWKLSKFFDSPWRTSACRQETTLSSCQYCKMSKRSIASFHCPSRSGIRSISATRKAAQSFCWTSSFAGKREKITGNFPGTLDLSFNFNPISSLAQSVVGFTGLYSDSSCWPFISSLASRRFAAWTEFRNTILD